MPAEINDCAALLRFSFREALRRHDAAWARQWSLPGGTFFSDVQAYNYPFTPLKASLFRVKDGVFAEFANAETLLLLNMHRISREIEAALAGDLLFFHQPSQKYPFHVMIWLDRGHVHPDRGPWIVYHTGPVGKHPGEIRRPSLAELRAHPEPRWRPYSGNPHFLGVYRWNILED